MEDSKIRETLAPNAPPFRHLWSLFTVFHEVITIRIIEGLKSIGYSEVTQFNCDRICKNQSKSHKN